ncbi:metabotropic glutamate receptor 4-like [Patiria miniata]|uniref:G-protein coupled receptors family 3 profile domain-containing protein n=1 Tax=Patiria miniata TaxID=46514 RepID=A0A914B4R3_PATMI|nr:metabotropic glutamate receptor 4-like [Patiria miniata]
MISHYATSDELSDKARFPNFLRTIPPDKLQARAMVDILEKFGWTCIGVLYTSDAYGIRGSQELLKLADEKEMCVVFSKSVTGSKPTQSEIAELLSKIDEFEIVHVIIIFGGEEMYDILEELECRKPGYRVTLICSDGIHGRKLSEVYLGNMTKGSLRLEQHRSYVPEFQDYFKSLEAASQVSPWYNELKDFIMKSNECVNLTLCSLPQYAMIESTIYHAVYAFAYALDDLIRQRCSSRTTDCSHRLHNISGQDLLPYLFNVQFEGVGGPFEFDANGNAEGAYTIKGLLEENNKIEWQDVGLWDSHRTQKLSMVDAAILWPDGTPQSHCKQECLPGQIAVPLQEKCSWGCQTCYKDAIVVDNACEQCKRTHWPSTNRSACEPIVPASVATYEVIIVVILVLCSTGIALAGLSFAGLCYYRHHSLIKASSRELGTVSIVGTISACLVPLPLLLPPSDHTCAAAEALVSLCFTMTYAPTLLKVNRIHRVFQAGRRSTKCPRLARPKEQIFIASIIVLIQI